MGSVQGKMGFRRRGEGHVGLPTSRENYQRRKEPEGRGTDLTNRNCSGKKKTSMLLDIEIRGDEKKIGMKRAQKKLQRDQNRADDTENDAFSIRRKGGGEESEGCTLGKNTNGDDTLGRGDVSWFGSGEGNRGGGGSP